MSFLSAIGNKIRDFGDDIGSVVTGQPAHGPAPAPAAAPTPIQPPVSQNPLPFLRQPNPSINLMGPQNPNPNISLSGASTTPNISLLTPSAHPTYQAPPPPVTHAGILHNITHNPVTNVVGGAAQFIPQLAENYSNTFANLGRKAAGAPDATIQQNMGGNTLLDNTLQMSGATGRNAQLGTDVAQVGLSEAVPAVAKIAEPVASGIVGAIAPRVAPKLAFGIANGFGEASSGLAPVASKAVSMGTGMLTAGGINSQFGGAQYLGNTPNPTIKGLAKSEGSGAAQGLAIGAGGEAIGLAAPFIRQALRDTDTQTKSAIPNGDAEDSAQLPENPGSTSPTMPIDNATGNADTASNSQNIPASKPLDTQSGDTNKTAPVKSQVSNLKLSAPLTDNTSKGFILKEGPIRGGRQDVVRVKFDPNTGNMVQSAETIDAPKAVQTTSAEDIGRALGMSDEDMQKARDTQPAVQDMPETPPKLSQDEKRDILQKDNQQTKNQVNLETKEGNTKGAIAEAVGIERERAGRFQIADRLGSKLDSHDQKLLSERSDPSIKIEAHDPKAFAKAASAYDDAYDYSLAADRAGGSTTLRYGSGKYAPLYLSATPEKMDELGINPEDRIQGKYTGFRDRARQYKSYTDAKGVGLDRLYKSPVEDARQYAAGGSVPIRNSILKATLARSNPGEIAEHGYGIDENTGRPYTQAAGHLPFDVSDNLQNKLANFKEAWQPASRGGKIALKSVEKANATMKQALFFGSPFHYVNITKNFLGLTASTGHFGVATAGMRDALASSLTPGGYARVIDRATKDGTLEYARKNGLEIADDKTLQGARKFSPSNQAHSNMNRFINAFGLQLAKAAKNHGVETGTPQATSLFEEYNKVLGRVNEAVSATNPTINKITAAGTLAPHYTRTQLALIKDAVPGIRQGKGVGLYKSGNVARGTVFGARAVETATAVISSAIAAGQMPTLHNLLNEAGLNKNNPVPNYEGSEKKKNGESQVINLPTDPLGLVAGLITDPKHFAGSRTSPGASFVQKLATNQNWNGERIADPNKPHYIANLIKGSAENSFAPIGAQNFTNLSQNQNNPNVKQGIIQEFGGRLKTNPNDPQAQSTNAYFNSMAQARSSLSPHDQTIFDELHKTETSSDYVSDTNPTGAVTLSPAQSMADAAQRAANPNVIAAEAKAAIAASDKSGQPHDPLYDESLAHQVIVQKLAGIPYKSDQYVNLENDNKSWLTPLNDARNAYFSSLPPSTSTKAINSQTPTYPSLTPDQSSMMTQVSQIAAIPTASRTPAQASTLTQLENNPDLQNAYSALDNYTTAKIKAQGYSPYKYVPNAPIDVQNFTTSYFAASSADKKALKANNPSEYNSMEANLAQQELSSVDATASQARIVGNPDSTNQELKDMQNIVNYGLVQTPNGLSVLGSQDAQNGTPLGIGGFASGSGGGSSYSAKNKILKAEKPRYLKNVKPYKHIVRKHKPRQYFASTKTQVKGVAHFIAPAKPKTIKLA